MDDLKTGGVSRSGGTERSGVRTIEFRHSSPIFVFTAQRTRRKSFQEGCSATLRVMCDSNNERRACLVQCGVGGRSREGVAQSGTGRAAGRGHPQSPPKFPPHFFCRGSANSDGEQSTLDPSPVLDRTARGLLLLLPFPLSFLFCSSPLAHR